MLVTVVESDVVIAERVGVACNQDAVSQDGFTIGGGGDRGGQVAMSSLLMPWTFRVTVCVIGRTGRINQSRRCSLAPWSSASRTATSTKANHSYDVPEIIATPIIGGSTEYLSWLVDETRG